MWPLAILLVALLFVLATRWMDRVYRYAASLAIAGHLFVATILIPNVPYDWDIAKFHRSALIVLHGGVPPYASTVTSFGTFQALVYTLTGSDPLSLAVSNGLLAVLIPFPLRALMRDLYPDLETTHVPTLLVLFLPLPFVMLTVPMRDCLTILVFCMILALFVRSIVAHTLWPATVAIPLWGMLYLLRPELALVVVVGSGAAVFVFGIDAVTVEPISLQRIVVSTTPFGLLGFSLFSSRFPLDRLNAKVTYRASGGAAYLPSFHYSSMLDALIAAPARALYFQFAPFPLHVEQIFHLLAVFTLPLLIVLALATIFSVIECSTDRIVLVFLAVVYGAGILGYGLIDSNFGTTARHRIPFVFLLIVFASPVLDRWWLELRRAYDVPD